MPVVLPAGAPRRAVPEVDRYQIRNEGTVYMSQQASGVPRRVQVLIAGTVLLVALGLFWLAVSGG